MDFDGAVKAHSNWMLRLFGYAKGSSKEKLDPKTIAKDNVCDLGKWLYGDGQKYAGEPEFSELIKAHAAFHKSAASVVELVDQGKRAAAQQILMSSDSDYCQGSSKVIGLLRKMERKCAGVKN